MSQRNYVCDLVKCINWDSIENGNDETSIDRWNVKCKECYHSMNNTGAKKCNFERSEE